MDKDHKIKTVKLKEIYGVFREQDLKRFELDVPIGTSVVYCYDFEKLKDELKNDGLKGNIEVMELGSKLPLVENKYIKRIEKYKYCVQNGNHRCLALEELYGEDHEIPVTIVPNLYQRTKGEPHEKHKPRDNSARNYRKLFGENSVSRNLELSQNKKPEDAKIFQEEMNQMTASSRALRQKQAARAKIGDKLPPVTRQHNTRYMYNVANLIPNE